MCTLILDSLGISYLRSTNQLYFKCNLNATWVSSARAKSYQHDKVVSGGRACGKSTLILAYPHFFYSNDFVVLGPCAWKKFDFCIVLIF